MPVLNKPHKIKLCPTCRFMWDNANDDVTTCKHCGGAMP